MQEQTTAWATLTSEGERSVHTAHWSLGDPDSRPTAGDLAAAAVAVELLDAFRAEAVVLDMSWSRAEVTVDLHQGERPRRIARVDYQLRVDTVGDELTEVAGHRLEGRAPIFATLATVAEHAGHVVVRRGGTTS